MFSQLMRRITLGLALVATLAPCLLAATAGPSASGTQSDDATVGTISWGTPSNAATSNDTRTTAATSGTTHYLKCTNFSFSIPAGATINGIQVDIEASRLNATSCTESEIKLVKSDATILTTNKSTGAVLPASTDAVVSYGGAADLWSWTPAYTDINDTDFGMVVSYVNVGAMVQARVDYVAITITYTITSTRNSNLTTLGVGQPVTYTQTRTPKVVQSAM